MASHNDLALETVGYNGSTLQIVRPHRNIYGTVSHLRFPSKGPAHQCWAATPQAELRVFLSTGLKDLPWADSLLSTLSPSFVFFPDRPRLQSEPYLTSSHKRWWWRSGTSHRLTPCKNSSAYMSPRSPLILRPHISDHLVLWLCGRKGKGNREMTCLHRHSHGHVVFNFCTTPLFLLLPLNINQRDVFSYLSTCVFLRRRWCVSASDR
jgi:hypothetical protein